MASIDDLKVFIEAARKSRKYPDNTAHALKTALRLFENELTEEEAQSVELFKENLGRIYQAVFDKNKSKYSASSLDTYRKRVSKLINDYLAYGTDPAKMNSWSPPLRKTTPRVKTKQSGQPQSSDDQEDEMPNGAQQRLNVPADSTRVDWPLGDGRQVTLILPANLTSAEAETVKQLVGLRVAHKDGNEKEEPQAA